MFADRRDAGRQLAHRLAALALVDPIVLALPRGGVPVAIEVAAALHAPLDLLLVRKIGAPDQPELAVAAVTDGLERIVINDETFFASGATRDYVEREAQAQRREIARRRDAWLHGRPPLPVQGRTAVVVDDGIATGTTLRAALDALRQRQPARVIVAVPVAPREEAAALRAEGHELVCLHEPTPFHAVGAHYADFEQLTDSDVTAALATIAPGPSPGSRATRHA